MSWLGRGPGDPPSDPEGSRWRDSVEDDGPIDDEGKRDLDEWLGPPDPGEGDDDDFIDDDDEDCPWCGKPECDWTCDDEDDDAPA